MSNKSLFVILSCFIIVLLFSLVIYFCYVRTYNDKYFGVSYSVDWTRVKGDTFKIKSRSGSTIEIKGQYDTSNTDVNDIYLDLNKKFLEKHSDYKLINTSLVLVGRDYSKGYELLYESDNRQELYIIVVKNNMINNINFSSSIMTFDIDLTYFYDVVNSLEVG